MAAVCICLKSACEAGLLDEQRLAQAAASELALKVRKVATAVADMMVCKAGSTVAFLLWRDGADVPARAGRLAGGFKQAYLLLPYQLLNNLEVLDTVSSLTCEDSLTAVYMPMGVSFTEHALTLASALLSPEATEGPWREQQAEIVATADAVNQVLLGLPLPPGGDGDAVHHANMLRMLGSLQHISQRRGEEIAAHTDIDGATASSIAAFFQMGEQQQGPAGLHLGPQMLSL